jgi:hypothetical protein
MSFLDDAVGFISGNSIASSLVKIAALSYVATQVSKNAVASNQGSVGEPITNIDQGVRLQIPPAANSKVPVLYGAAFFGGNITDAVMTNTNKTMYYCLTLSEKTGTKLSTGQATDYVFKDVY